MLVLFSLHGLDRPQLPISFSCVGWGDSFPWVKRGTGSGLQFQTLLAEMSLKAAVPKFLQGPRISVLFRDNNK